MRYLLHDVLTDAVEIYPNKTAIISENGNRISYQDLNKLSNQYARLLSFFKQNIRNNPYVGVLSCVNIQSIAGVLGCLKIGGAYVPLDEYSPFERLRHIVENTKLNVILLDSIWLDKYRDLINIECIEAVILLDDCISSEHIFSEKIIMHSSLFQFSDLNISPLNQVSDDLAYVLHSSGSTGIPKGIMLTHRNARTFVDWMHREFRICSSDLIMSRAPFKFDLSVFDIFNTLKAGATLICFDWTKKRIGDEKHRDYVKLMERENATILYTTPSTYISLMNRGGLADANLSLRTIMYAGEPFPLPQLRNLFSILPETSFANIYGPTETNIITYYWICEVPGPDCVDIPLGNVVEDTEIIVVSDDNSHICEPHEIGELWCRGGTVTLGYLGLPEKTMENLVRSPFHPFPAYFWRTGDYGFVDSNGLLHYRGRKDHMVKVKGFRIEIGEVENAISGFPGLDEFAVIAIKDEKYGNRLYCFYSSLSGMSIHIDAFISYIKERLPDYMLPYKFIELPEMPKTSSGKIDRLYLERSYE